ncbi:TraR/DksA C4-type zinc finger protein [Bacillus sp. S/N-304-OC-R1]|uniref:TraR/DksA C4-type zinc finger protein n=1 Tax=Bacillus sp. S/N-304-OC-R1 TaxID=2758034 RepID=UPI001C8D4995|nr:TraR/DksA C4-type zinc finger protein [Bacillus sp. S/N-304-OC-R1]MBY0122866.1 TraR/DksA C4-type zinc finger protein [Bacillus sp. S/N-304-OC-R1]
MLSTEQLNQLMRQLEEEKTALESQLHGNKEGSLEGVNARETVGELSAYDNHPADMGTELFDRTKDFALEEHHDSQLNKVNAALEAMSKGSYGKCTVCGEGIPFERLEAVPYTLYCKEHSPERIVPGDRPVEEEVLEPAHGNTFQHHQFREVIDNEDSFQEVARYGTSETPADLRGDYEDYNSLYNEGHDDEGFTEDYETFIGNNIEGTDRIIYPSKKHEEYEAMLDEAGTDTPFFDLHYRETDGYVDDED